MVRSLLIRGMLVGAIAGVLAFVFALIFGEPQIDKAIALEEAMARAAGESDEAPIVTRAVQSGIGLFTGCLMVGIGLGGIFSLVYAYAYGRVGNIGPRTTAAVLGLAAFVTVTLIPFTKYPANPPTVGDPETISRRTLLFLTMIAISVVAAVAAARVRRATLKQLGPWNAMLIGIGAFLALVVVAELLMPSVNEVAKDFPADLLYRFRIASLGISATMWASIAIGFGIAAERLLAPAHAPRTAVARGLAPD